MADGTIKPISEVEVGDWVLAEDPQAGERGVPASALDAGDLVFTADGATLTVHGLAWGSAGTTTAYNLTVDEIHTYYVQGNGQRVYVLSNGNRTSSAAILDGPLTTDPLASVLESVSDSSLANRIADGRWLPLGDL